MVNAVHEKTHDYSKSKSNQMMCKNFNIESMLNHSFLTLSWTLVSPKDFQSIAMAVKHSLLCHPPYLIAKGHSTHLNRQQNSFILDKGKNLYERKM